MLAKPERARDCGRLIVSLSGLSRWNLITPSCHRLLDKSNLGDEPRVLEMQYTICIALEVSMKLNQAISGLSNLWLRISVAIGLDSL